MTATTEQLAKRYNGYHRVSDAREDPELTHTGPGTPCGEYFRRFWMPVAMTEQVGERPILVKVLGEELVLFRDLSGRIGLLHKHCSHRRASLEYGIVSERGIRCCYHGWLFDVDGTILEAPGEPENSPIPRKLCHGAYPAREFAGLIFACLGPPELTPEFPMFDTFSFPGIELVPYLIDYPCNWLQVAENPMDPFHSVFLHTRVTRAHFNPAWGAMPVVEWHPFEDRTGIYLTNVRRWEDFIWVRTAEVLLPAVAQPPDIYQNPDREKFFPGVGITKWTVPVDDTHCRIIAYRHFGGELDLDGKGDRSKVGMNKVDFVGQTGSSSAPTRRARRCPATTRPRSPRDRSRCTRRSGSRPPTRGWRSTAECCAGQCGTSQTATSRRSIEGVRTGRYRPWPATSSCALPPPTATTSSCSASWAARSDASSTRP